MTDSNFRLITDDIDSIIDASKKAATAANRSTSDTVEKLNNIKAEVKKISISPTVSNVDSVLRDVDKNGEGCMSPRCVFISMALSQVILTHNTFCLTVKNLSSSIPSLLDKIQELDSQLSAGHNVSDNINKIKELIEEAREAANRVRHILTHTFQ